MPGPSPALFFETINAYQRTEALKAAIELNLFTAIAQGNRTAETIALACRAAPRGIRILADYLSTIGFLRKSAQEYSLSPDAEVFLVDHSSAYLGGAMEFLLAPNLRECFSLTSEAVRRGGTAHSSEGTVSYDNPIWVAFARAMKPLMQMPARLLVDLVQHDREQPLKILDIAAGHGIFGITLAEQFPHAHVTALDWPNVLHVAQDNAEQAGVSDRYSLLPGSAFEIDWAGPYDLVLLTNILHHFDLELCLQLAKKSHACLTDTGRAITLEFIPDEDRITPASTAGFALTMLTTTASGDAYTFAEYDQILQQAGFFHNEFHPLPPTTQQAIVSHKSLAQK